MATNIILGSTLRVQVSFQEWQDPDLILPYTEVYVQLLSSDQNLIAEYYPEELAPGVYFIDWTPEELGSFYIRFTAGPFNVEEGDNVHRTVIENFTVTEEKDNKVHLNEDQEIVFTTELYPLFADPDEFMTFYPDASRVEIMETIYRFSREVDKIFKGREPSFTAYEYIRAAVLCSLSKVHDYFAGDVESLTLGDLKVASQSYPRQQITRANAATWCELAAALRQDMIRGEGNMKAVVKGRNFPDPMPERRIKSPYNGNGGRYTWRT